MWHKIGTGNDGAYGIWVSFDMKGDPVYRIQKAPIIPQGVAGYRNLEAYRKLMGVSFDEPIIT